jgi:hypothetical protein
MSQLNREGYPMKTVKTLLGMVTLLLLLGTPCFGADLTQSFAAKEGFTIHLPKDWEPIPKEVIDKYSQAIAKMAPKAETQLYNYGFQRADSPKWFTYPYILVQVNRSGRIPEEQLKSLKRIEKAMGESFAKTTDSISSFSSNASLGEPVYDPASHILWTRIAIDVKKTGTVQGIIGSILTEEGFVQIACYAKNEDFEKYLPVFETIIKKTDFKADLKLGAQDSEGNAVGEKSGQGALPWKTIFLVLIGALLLFFAGWRIRKKASGDS